MVLFSFFVFLDFSSAESAFIFLECIFFLVLIITVFVFCMTICKDL